MKSLIITILLLFFSCSDQKEKEKSSTALQVPDVELKNETVVAKDSTLTKWVEYYRIDNPDFDEKNFELVSSSLINFSETNVTMMNAKGFNESYKPFFVFNKSGSQYLDFDSYHWTIAPDGIASFEADQQVALIDLKNKTARQIAFFGPSYSIEDAYWKGDSTAVLLGNSYEKVPFLMKFNFPKNKVQYFQSRDTLKFEIPYSQVRLQNLGIRTE